MADTKIRIELDAEGAKQKLKRFDEDRAKARKKTAKAEKRQAAKAKREKRDGALTAAAGVVVAIRSPKLSAIQKRAEEAVPKTLLEQARITAGAVAPFAAAGIPLDAEQILQIRDFAALQASNKIEEELRAKKKFGRAVGNVLAEITGVGG